MISKEEERAAQPATPVYAPAVPGGRGEVSTSFCALAHG
jgi:hypothetical protein